VLLGSISKWLSLQHNFIFIFRFHLQVCSLIQLGRYVEGRVLRWGIKLGLAHYGTIFGIVKVLNCDAVFSIALSFTISLNDVSSCFAFNLHSSTYIYPKWLQFINSNMQGVIIKVKPKQYYIGPLLKLYYPLSDSILYQ